jgi:hypothetical protein
MMDAGVNELHGYGKPRVRRRIPAPVYNLMLRCVKAQRQTEFAPLRSWEAVRFLMGTGAFDLDVEIEGAAGVVQ